MMLRSIYLFALYSVVISSADSLSPIGANNVRRIAKGQDSPFLPFYVTIDSKQFPFQFCGGSFIAKRVVITTASCVEDSRREDLIVYFGGNDFQLCRHELQVLFVDLHPNYTKGDLSEKIYPQNNMAIIGVDDLKGNVLWQVVHIGNFSDNPPIWVAGLGGDFPEYQFHHVASRKLSLAKVDVVENKYCEEPNKSTAKLQPNEFCFITNGSYVAYGDEGGPVFKYFQTFQEDYRLIGIINFTDDCKENGTVITSCSTVAIDLNYELLWMRTTVIKIIEFFTGQKFNITQIVANPYDPYHFIFRPPKRDDEELNNITVKN